MAARIQMGVKSTSTPEFVPDSQVLDNQARAKALGVTIPGLKSPGIVSSADPLMQKSQDTATSQAASSLLTSGMPNYYEMMNQRYEQDQAAMKEGVKGLKLSLNADLAGSDLKYKELHDELQTGLNQSLDIANANAAALNPYSQAEGAQTADNFTGAIKAKYADQARKLQRQAELAQQEIKAGNYEKYLSLMKEGTKQARDFQDSMYTWMQTEQKREADAAKAKYDQGQDAITNFVTLLKTNLPDMEALDQMNESQLLALPAAQAGIAAGYDVNSVIQSLYDAAASQATDRTKEALDIEKTRLDMANTRSIMSERGKSDSDKVPTFAKYLEAAEAAAQMTLDEGMVAELRKRYDMLYASAKIKDEEDDLALPPRQ